MPETVLVEKVEIKEGVSEKTHKPWRRLDVYDGNGERYSTFELQMHELAKKCEGGKAEIDYITNGKFRDLLSIKPAEQNGDVPLLGTGDYVRGQTAPADKLSIHASVSLKEAVATLGPRAAASNATANEIYKSVAALADLYFVWLQRKSGFQVADEDLPF